MKNQLSRNDRRGSHFHNLWRLVLAGIVIATSVSTSAFGADEPQTIPVADVRHDGPVDFAREVQPLLQKHCLACHNAMTHEAGLNLENPQSILKGGDSGPAAVATKGAESLLITRASGSVDTLMPPKGNKAAAEPLSSEELGLIKLWIDQGATGTSAAVIAPNFKPLAAAIKPIYAVTVTPDGLYAACSRGNQIYVYHVPTQRLVCQLTDPEFARAEPAAPPAADRDLIQSLAISPDGFTLASGGYRTIRLWTRPQNVRAYTIEAASQGTAACAAVTADGKIAALAEDDGQIRLWDATTGSPLRTIAAHEGRVASLCFSVDGARLYSGGVDRSLRAWNVADGAALGGIATPAAISSVVVVGDGQQIAATGDNVIRVWNVADLPHEQIAEIAPAVTLTGHEQQVTALVTLGGMPARLLSASLDGTARQWNIAEGRETAKLDHGSAVSAIAARADGTRCATGGANGVIKLWNLSDGKLVAELRGELYAQLNVARAERTIEGRKRDVEFWANAVTEAEKAASVEADVVKKADEAIEKAVKTLADKAEAAKKAESERADAEKASAEATAAAKGAAEAALAAEKTLADAESAAKRIAEMATEAAAASTAAPSNTFLADAKSAGEKSATEAAAKVTAAKEAKTAADKVAADAPNKVKAAEEGLAAKTKAAADAAGAQKGAESAKTTAEQAQMAAVASSTRAAEAVPKAQQARTSAEDALRQAAAAATESAKLATEATSQPVRAIAFSPDGKQLVSGGDDRLVHLWNADSGAAIGTYAGSATPLSAVAFISNDRVLSAGADGSATAWELYPAWQWQRTIGAADGTALVDRVTSLDFSPDGRLLASGGGEPSRSGELKIWNVADGALVREIAEAHSDTILGLDFSPDGKSLASCAADRFVKVFEVDSGRSLRAFEGHTHHVMAVCWQASGRVLASSGADGAIKVWNFDTGEQIRTLGASGKEVTSVSFVGTSEAALAASGDNQVSLWTTNNGKKTSDFRGAGDFIYAAAITPDGRLVVAGGQDAVLRGWDGTSTKPLFSIAAPQP